VRQEDRALESANTKRTHAFGALHAHAVAWDVDGELCAVVAASRRLPLSICVKIVDAIGHVHAAERIAIHLKLPVQRERRKMGTYMYTRINVKNMCAACKYGNIYIYMYLYISL